MSGYVGKQDIFDALGDINMDILTNEVKEIVDELPSIDMDLINKDIYELKEKLKDRDTLIERLLEDLEEIREAVWGYDIPSPTVPEYIEHHEQIQELLKLIDEKIKRANGGS